VLVCDPSTLHLLNQILPDFQLGGNLFGRHEPFESIENKVQGFIFDSKLRLCKLVWPKCRCGRF
jgi:hypothetical protein